MTYFMVSCSEGGDVLVRSFDKEGLLEVIGRKHYAHVVFMEALDIDDPKHWENQVLIIKGEVVTPWAKTVVVEYDI